MRGMTKPKPDGTKGRMGAVPGNPTEKLGSNKGKKKKVAKRGKKKKPAFM